MKLGLCSAQRLIDLTTVDAGRGWVTETLRTSRGRPHEAPPSSNAREIVRRPHFPNVD